MSSNGLPSAAKILGESVGEYRRGFSGVARAMLPVFAVFAVGQIGFALAGDPEDFRGYALRALALAALGVALVAGKTAALSGIVAEGDRLGRASLAEIYRAGGRTFWSVVWAGLLAGLALASSLVVFAATIFFGGVALRAAGGSLAAALAVIASAALLAALAALAVLSRVAVAFPLVARGEARGVRALETSASLSEGRWWAVTWRLGVGLLAAVLAALPFALIDQAADAPWSRALLAAAGLLLAAPLFALHLGVLARRLADTAGERAAAKVRRPWVRALVWVGAAAIVLWVGASVF